MRAAGRGAPPLAQRGAVRVLTGVPVRACCDREGAGQQVGLEIWRVENRRTEADTPDFGVKRWPKEEYGKFFKGDSYIIMNTFLADPDAAKFSFGEDCRLFSNACTRVCCELHDPARANRSPLLDRQRIYAGRVRRGGVQNRGTGRPPWR